MSKPSSSPNCGGLAIAFHEGRQPVSDSADSFTRVVALLEQISNQLAVGQPEALTIRQAAQLIGVSNSKFRQMDSAGHVPARIQEGTGNCPRWLRRELVCWLYAGAPVRSVWISMRATALRGA